MTVKISGNSSASTPSFAGDDGDSGLHATADQVQLVTNGTVGVTVDSSQNVGIGTTTPGTKLEVGGAITSKTSAAGLSDQSITFSESGSGNGYGVRLGHVSNTEFAFERYDFGWAETVRVNGAGSVLLGTTDGNFASGKGLKIADAGAARIKLCDTDTGVGSLDGMDFSFAGVDGYIENRENGALIIATNNTERMRVLSGGGLTFNGDTSTNNALDDYEEGSWTPFISGTSGGSFTAGSANVGRYTKVGSLVTASATIDWTNASYSGLAYIGGLPFLTNSTTHYRAAGIMPGQSNGFYATGSFNTLRAGTDNNINYAYVVQSNDTISSGVNYNHYPGLNTSGIIYGFTITYRTD